MTSNFMWKADKCVINDLAEQAWNLTYFRRRIIEKKRSLFFPTRAWKVPQISNLVPPIKIKGFQSLEIPPDF